MIESGSMYVNGCTEWVLITNEIYPLLNPSLHQDVLPDLERVVDPKNTWMLYPIFNTCAHITSWPMGMHSKDKGQRDHAVINLKQCHHSGI